MVHFEVIILLLSLAVVNAIGTCPSGLGKNCACEARSSGFYITCQTVGTDLNGLFAILEKIQVDRLTVVQSSLPFIRKIHPAASIRSLRLVGCGVGEIEPEAFVPLADTIEEIVIANNSLTEFPVFGQLPKLLFLNLNNNKLSSITSNAFDGLSGVRHLRLEGNQLREIRGDLLNPLKESLSLLDLSDNQLTAVPAESLSGMQNLMYLDLANNKISGVSPGDFDNLPFLKELRLSENAITRIDSQAFRNVPQLQYFHLQGNMLSDVDSLDIPTNFRKLEIFDLSRNALHKVPKLRGHERIRQVKLDQNRIASVETLAFDSNPMLQLISLQNNQVATLGDNCFHGLEHLTILLLENNYIRKLEKQMLRGMRSLQQLDLRNNSLNEIGNNTFRVVPNLKILDLSFNGLHRLPKSLFVPLRNLVWLDLSYNVLSTFEEGTFGYRIPHILLVGNPLHCDPKMEKFVAYVMRNKVRIQLPVHPEVTCTSPEKYVGVRLMNLMTKKAEDTLNIVGKTLNHQSPATLSKSDAEFFKGLIPGGLMRLIPGLAPTPPPNMAVDVPVFGAIAESVPALRTIPGLGFIPKPTGRQAEQVRKLNSAIEQFSTPLVRVASGDSLLLVEDLDQMVKALPNLAMQPSVDLSQLPAESRLRAFHGEKVPGFTKDVIDKSMKDYMNRVYEAASEISRGNSLLDQPEHLLMLNDMPKEIVHEIVTGGRLPYMNDEQMKVIKEYYSAQAPSTEIAGSSGKLTMDDIQLSPELFKMMKLLPPGYDIGKIPKDVVVSLSNGELPDLRRLPEDLQQHFLKNFETVLVRFSKSDVEVKEVINKLPKFERQTMETFPPYISTDVTGRRGQSIAVSQGASHWILIVLGIIAVASAIILGTFCIRRRRKLQEIVNHSCVLGQMGERMFSTPRHTRRKSSDIRLHPSSFYRTPSCGFSKIPEQ